MFGLQRCILIKNYYSKRCAWLDRLTRERGRAWEGSDFNTDKWK